MLSPSKGRPSTTRRELERPDSSVSFLRHLRAVAAVTERIAVPNLFICGGYHLTVLGKSGSAFSCLQPRPAENLLPSHSSSQQTVGLSAYRVCLTVRPATKAEYHSAQRYPQDHLRHSRPSRCRCHRRTCDSPAYEEVFLSPEPQNSRTESRQMEFNLDRHNDSGSASSIVANNGSKFVWS
jgi:hypothetical protein